MTKFKAQLNKQNKTNICGFPIPCYKTSNCTGFQCENCQRDLLS